MFFFVFRVVAFVFGILALWVVLHPTHARAKGRPTFKNNIDITNTRTIPLEPFGPFTTPHGHLNEGWPSVAISPAHEFTIGATGLDFEVYLGSGPPVAVLPTNAITTFEANGPAPTGINPSRSGIAVQGTDSSSNSSGLVGIANDASVLRDKPRERIEFRTIWPRSLGVGQWHSLLVYVYRGVKGWKSARMDFERHLLGEDSLQVIDAAEVVAGAEIAIVPMLSGVDFNPPRVTLQWLESWHRVEFRMRARNASVSFVKGLIAFYVGPVQIAETPIAVNVITEPEKDDMFAESCAFPYASIFVSYAHEDAPIVEAMEKIGKVIGNSYLRDIVVLRSGEKWREALLRHIEQSNIFQLCWSTAAKHSIEVAEEWALALSLNRDKFIRPVFWERPMPKCPPELQHLHFQHLDIDNYMRPSAN